MFQQMKYFDVYFLCQSANRLLSGGFERQINDFFEPLFECYDTQNCFNKHSLLHSYCEWVVEQNIWDREGITRAIKEAYRMREYSRKADTLWIDIALNEYCDKQYDVLTWIAQKSDTPINQLTDTDLEELHREYLSYLWAEEAYDDVLLRISNEMFYVLFQNRAFLYNFNFFITAYNHQIKKRLYIPKWVKNAVFFRDRGRCVFCRKDLSGTISIKGSREVHYDHIIPLANNGVNDVSNLQLACRECNQQKRTNSSTSIYYQQWYECD